MFWNFCLLLTVFSPAFSSVVRCSKSQWQCRDSSCIEVGDMCDGNVDCPDGSDETLPLCRKMQCHSNWFRCTYGACVEKSAPCNGKQDCADNSDELLPRCRGESYNIRSKFTCQNGEVISSSDYCDGVPNCSDGSDETLRACAAQTCQPYFFQCAYGACVDQGSECNGKIDCADGSDESDELCNNGTSSVTTKPIDSTDIIGTTDTTDAYSRPMSEGKCVLPPYPKDGEYVVGGVDGSPGETFPSAFLNVTCNRGFVLNRIGSISCFDGEWSSRMPQCEPCGTITLGAQPLMIGGQVAKRGEMPWHAGIYKKASTGYQQICGGTLISPNVIISAAHCFWDDEEHKKVDKSNYAVAVGKIYRGWEDKHDYMAQKRVKLAALEVSEKYYGVLTNYQDDIAVIVVDEPFTYKPSIRPACIDFDKEFDKQQLQNGALGKVAGWGIISAEQKLSSPFLKVIRLPYVDLVNCREIMNDFLQYITSDKMCAGYTNGTVVCQGDSGGGLTFREGETAKYFLRGIVSTAPQGSEVYCKDNTLTTFTHITDHKDFIKTFLL